MANGDRWRNDQDRYGRREDERERWREEGRSRDYERGGRGGWPSDYPGGQGREDRGFGGEFGQGGRFGESRGGEGYGRGWGGDDWGRGSSGRGRESWGGSMGGGQAGEDYGRGRGDYRGFGAGGRGSEYGYEGGFGGYGREGYGRGSGEYGRRGEERGFWERASDEVSSWFGDREAERRREIDHRGRGPKGYQRSDDRIREDVNDRLSDDPYVDASEIEVSVSNGEVTLSGTVDSREAKRRAEDIAERVSGVRHVQNNLRVQQQGQHQGATATSQTQSAAGGAQATTPAASTGARQKA